MCGSIGQATQVRSEECGMACGLPPVSEFDESKENGLSSVVRTVRKKRGRHEQENLLIINYFNVHFKTVTHRTKCVLHCRSSDTYTLLYNLED